MNTTKVQRLRQQVWQFRERFLLNMAATLGPLLSAAELEQVLSADHSCQDAVARNVGAQLCRAQPAPWR